MAMPTVSVITLIHNLADATPVLLRAVFGLMYLAGFMFVFSAVYKLKHYGDMRTMMSSSAELKGPLVHFFIGACLIFYPQIVTVSLDTVFGSNTLLAYDSMHNEQLDGIIQDAILIIRLVGFVAFFRGMLILSRLGGHNVQPQTFSKAMLHIIGGIVTINVVGSWDILKGLFGL